MLLPPDDPSYRIIVVHDEGFSEVTRADFEKSPRITLQAWGRMEGSVMLGNKPDAGRTIDYQPRLPINRNGFRGLNYRYSTIADENGHFALERVLPGSGTVSRAVSIQENQNMWMEVPAWQTPIEVTANETAGHDRRHWPTRCRPAQDRSQA